MSSTGNVLTRSMIVGLVVVMGTFALAPQAKAARAFFVFGDSLVDSGNNNYLITPARADYPPYGIDYPNHLPTGRFSNGLNFPDIISELLGFEAPLPYLNPELKGTKLLKGANFASAGIGILNDTGIQFAHLLRIFKQFELFEEYQRRVSAIIGPVKTKQLVNNALVLIALGGNDYVNNYFLTPLSIRRHQFSIPEYSRYLVSEYKKILKSLYELGARIVLVGGAGPLGCVPSQLALSVSKNDECVPEPQKAAEIYNSELLQMLQSLNREIGSVVFIFSNNFAMNMDVMNNPEKFGFKVSKTACCGQGPFNGLGLCNQYSSLCPNRDRYVFWDAFHPTERALRLMVEQIIIGSIQYVSPVNLSTIMAMDVQT